LFHFHANFHFSNNFVTKKLQQKHTKKCRIFCKIQSKENNNI